jgi:vancomycin resistance protein VanJ
MVEAQQVTPIGWKRRSIVLLLALSDVYSGSIALYVLLRILTGYHWWPIAFASNMIHAALIPALPVMITLLVAHRWKRAAVAAIGGAAFLWWYGALFLPSIPPMCPTPCETITILQLNMASGRFPAENLTAPFAASNAGIITMEELTDEQIDILRHDLPSTYHYSVMEAGQEAGLLSRYPIMNYDYIKELPGRSYLRAELNIDGEALVVLVAHPYVGTFDTQPLRYFSPSHDAFAWLAEEAQSGAPTILAGDLNMVDQSPDYDLLAQSGLTDAFRAAGWGYGLSYPASGATSIRQPFVRIDYIWHTDHFRTVRAWIGPDWGSDHRSLWAEILRLQD